MSLRVKPRICFYGPTGSGKSTLCEIAKVKCGGAIKKIAAPLYEFQALFYLRLGKTIAGQDGELLQFLGNKIERECPGWLAAQFLARIEQCAGNAIILNDDCRWNSYAHLKQAGFIFVKVNTLDAVRKCRARADHSAPDKLHQSELGFDLFEYDYVVDNNGTLDDASMQIDAILKDLLDD